jgi:hypothetical protein
MKLRSLFLCDAASMHPDNTFSILRGGIDNFNIAIPEGQPLSQLPPTNFALIGIIELEVTEMGRLHNLEVALMDADGSRVIPELRLNFQPPVKTSKGRHNILLNISQKFNKPGAYCFYINVDGHELGDFPFQVNFQGVKK